MTDPVLDPRLGVACTYGDPVTWREALELLFGLLPGYAGNLGAAMEAGDAARVRGVAHSLAGASSYCGTVAVHVSAKRLEALCLQDDADALPDAAKVVLHNIERLLNLRQSGTLPPPDGAPVY